VVVSVNAQVQLICSSPSFITYDALWNAGLHVNVTYCGCVQGRDPSALASFDTRFVNSQPNSQPYALRLSPCTGFPFSSRPSVGISSDGSNAALRMHQISLNIHLRQRINSAQSRWWEMVNAIQRQVSQEGNQKVDGSKNQGGRCS
jgi:hypothetical protein